MKLLRFADADNLTLELIGNWKKGWGIEIVEINYFYL